MKQCANKCRANIERKTWEKREKLFKTKDPRRFKTPFNHIPLGDRLLYNGEITCDPTTIQSCWVDHFHSIFQSRATCNPDVMSADHDLPRLLSLSRINCYNALDDEFMVKEIELAVRKLKRDKSGGMDGLLPEHIKYGGPLLTLWLKQIFNNIAHFEQIPSCLLTGIIKLIYKGRGKDPLICHSYRGITMTSVIMKVFEYTLLERILPILQDHGHPALIQTAYQKHISCQDAIFAMQEIIQNSLLEGEVSYL